MAQLLSEVEEYVNVLYFGVQGTGKTTHMARLSQLGKVVHVDAEGGLKPTALKKRGVNLDNVEVERPRTYEQFEKLYWSLKGRLEDGEPIVGISFDSFTEVQALMVGEAVDTRIAKLTKAGQEVDPFTMDREDYNRWSQQARKLTRMFRDLPVHVSWSALSKRQVGDDGVLFIPALSPAFAVDLKGYVDLVCYTVTAENPAVRGGVEYLGVFRRVKTYEGKDRYAVTPVVMADPSWDRLVALVRGQLDLAKDPAQQAYLQRIRGGGAEYRVDVELQEAEANSDDPDDA